MREMHKHKCSMCGTIWEHHESFENYRAHICQKCGYLELMVYKPGDAPFNPNDHPQAVANFLKVLNDPDDSVRAAAAFSLGCIAAEPQRVVPVLAERATWDRHPAVRQAATEAVRRFGFEVTRGATGPNLACR